MKKISISAAIAAVLCAGLFMASPSAIANTLTATSPTSGAVLSSAPNAISVTGTSALTDQGTALSVTDPSGLRVDDGSITINDTTAVIGLKPLIAAGVYTVTYTLISTSDVPLTGSYTFLFNAPASLSSPSPTPTQSASVAPANKVTHTADIFVIILMVFAIFVGIFLLWYARMLLRERQLAKRKSRSRKKTPSSQSTRQKKADEE
jgi:methionine-rich copper-binding protein CopC